MIAFVVAAMSHTLVDRRPAIDGCGTRIQTLPEAFATSIAATRSSRSSCSSASSSSMSPVIRHLLTSLGKSTGLPGGLGQGTDILIGVLVATVRDPSGRAPAPD